MSKVPKGDSFSRSSNKNIKNIYVEKIKSLVSISRKSLAEDEVEMLISSRKYIVSHLGMRRN
jgi:type III secretory pathway lipoprotein EscJ